MSEVKSTPKITSTRKSLDLAALCHFDDPFISMILSRDINDLDFQIADSQMYLMIFSSPQNQQF